MNRNPFVDMGTTGAWAERLAWRQNQLLEPYAAQIVNRTVLDLGCHDGRWMDAILKIGARHVIGVDARSDNLSRCEVNLRAAGHEPQNYTLRRADLEDQTSLDDFEFEIVIAFGVLYHLLSPLALLQRICSTRPSMLLIDTAVAAGTGRFVRLYAEDSSLAGNGIATMQNNATLVCHPSEDAVSFVLQQCGYEVQVRRWNEPHVEERAFVAEPIIPSAAHPLIDYQSGSRVLFLANLRAS
ncbi:MAG: class I SAM-dependent methyltransferase [Sphingorhabdus sp.]|uniref:class I SAM-dependent methyltransferase n=1 Tax=Sphingorhabdus sp. TaxID=1902408 RepID=UPI003CB38497